MGVAYSVAEDRDGGIWLCLNGGNATLARYFNNHWTTYGAAEELPPGLLTSIVAGRDGTLWVTTLHTIVYLKPGETRFRKTNEEIWRDAGLAEDLNGKIWVSDSLTGTRRLPDYARGETLSPSEVHKAVPTHAVGYRIGLFARRRALGDHPFHRNFSFSIASAREESRATRRDDRSTGLHSQ